MPSRFFTGFILLFWAITSGWFFYAEFWPRLRGGDPPPFTIDLADEARKLSPSIEWQIIRGGEKIGPVTTNNQYREETDTFELSGMVHDLDLGKASLVRVAQMTNRYRVTREGQLLAVGTEAILQFGRRRIQSKLWKGNAWAIPSTPTFGSIPPSSSARSYSSPYPCRHGAALSIRFIRSIESEVCRSA